MGLFIKTLSALITAFVLFMTFSARANAKVIVDDGNTNKIYLEHDGKQISPAEAYKQALQEKDVLQCEHMDIKINAKTGKPSLTKSK